MAISKVRFEIGTPGVYYQAIAHFEDSGYIVQDVRPVWRSGPVYAHVNGISLFTIFDRDEHVDRVTQELITEGFPEDACRVFLPDGEFRVIKGTLGDLRELGPRHFILPTFRNYALMANILSHTHPVRPGDRYPRVSAFLRGVEGYALDVGDFLNTWQHMEDVGALEIISERFPELVQARPVIQGSFDSRALVPG
jgi:hypothetical protein